MRITKLRKTVGFFKSLFFVYNECKMRKALMTYLDSEGIKNEYSEGNLTIEYDDIKFSVCFGSQDDYAECEINALYQNDELTKLSKKDVLMIEEDVNADPDRYARMYINKDVMWVRSNFFFSNKAMMLNLFARHIDDISFLANDAMSQLNDKLQKPDEPPIRRIGFVMEEKDKAEATELKVVASA